MVAHSLIFHQILRQKKKLRSERSKIKNRKKTDSFSSDLSRHLGESCGKVVYKCAIAYGFCRKLNVVKDVLLSEWVDVRND